MTSPQPSRQLAVEPGIALPMGSTLTQPSMALPTSSRTGRNDPAGSCLAAIASSLATRSTVKGSAEGRWQRLASASHHHAPERARTLDGSQPPNAARYTHPIRPIRHREGYICRRGAGLLDGNHSQTCDNTSSWPGSNARPLDPQDSAPSAGVRRESSPHSGCCGRIRMAAMYEVADERFTAFGPSPEHGLASYRRMRSRSRRVDGPSVAAVRVLGRVGGGHGLGLMRGRRVR